MFIPAWVLYWWFAVPVIAAALFGLGTCVAVDRKPASEQRKYFLRFVRCWIALFVTAYAGVAVLGPTVENAVGVTICLCCVLFCNWFVVLIAGDDSYEWF